MYVLWYYIALCNIIHTHTYYPDVCNHTHVNLNTIYYMYSSREINSTRNVHQAVTEVKAKVTQVNS